MPKSPDKDVPPSFEDAMDELDGIVQAMEGDKLSLAELIEQYARGMKLEKICRSQLAVARQRVESITEAADGSGDLEIEDFDPAAPGEAEPLKGKSVSKPSRASAETKPKPQVDLEDDEIRLF